MKKVNAIQTANIGHKAEQNNAGRVSEKPAFVVAGPAAQDKKAKKKFKRRGEKTDMATTQDRKPEISVENSHTVESSEAKVPVIFIKELSKRTQTLLNSMDKPVKLMKALNILCDLIIRLLDAAKTEGVSASMETDEEMAETEQRHDE